METLTVLVCGGRNYADATTLWHELDMLLYALAPDCGLKIIHGAARGADQIADAWCLDRTVRCDEYPARWARDGRRAGPIRNQRMLDRGKPNLVLAFPGGSGTADMVKRARAAGIEVREVAR